jgi:hypothetical protein
MLYTGRHLIECAREYDDGVASSKRLALVKSSNLLLLFYGMTVKRAAKGFSLHQSNCKGMGENLRCRTFTAGRKGLVKNVMAMLQPRVVPVGASTRIIYIANDPI